MSTGYLDHGIPLCGRVPQHEIAGHANNSLDGPLSVVDRVLERDNVADDDSSASPIVLAGEEVVAAAGHGGEHGDAPAGE